MSDPKNPLENYETYLTHSVLAVFPDTIEAESADIPLSTDLDMGDQVPNTSGIIIANDGRPSATQIQQFFIEYNWTSIEKLTTLTAGEIILADRNATGFLTFLQQNVVGEFDISLENLTFVLKVFWVVGDDIIDSKEFFFSVPEIRHNTTNSANYYMLSMLALYNGKAQLPNYSKMYNMTITHKDGNLHEEIPSPDAAGGGIRPRAEEDASKLEPRKTRIDKSKPMETLKDVFEALEVELEESTEIHSMQLQRWQEIIRSDFIDKLKSPAEQEKDIPIKYKVVLEDPYPSYNIDNRNLPFEQPEQAQTIKGIRTIPCKTGSSIYSLIYNIMALSKQVGIDAKKGFLPKVVAVWRKQGDEILIDLRIKRVETPYNENGGVNTGPGESAVEPLTFFYRSNSGPEIEQNTDVYKIMGKTSRNTTLTVVEESPEEEDGRSSYGSDRENITVERMKDVDFFKAGYSGNRAFVNNKVMGVEYPNELAQYLSSSFTMQYNQHADIIITIRGNPSLFSDVLRKPSDVANGTPGDNTYYKFPELLPLYCKFRIYYTDSSSDDSLFESESVTGEFYHEDAYMHIKKLENHFNNGIFYQKIYLTRTDSLI